VLSGLLDRRLSERGPVRVGLIGAGVFGTMAAGQLGRLAGVHLVGVCDLDPGRARSSLAGAGWSDERLSARGPSDAIRDGGTWLTDDARALIASGGAEVLIEATGDPAAAATHALLAIDHGLHVVNVTVEADALLGPLLAQRAERAGVVYSYASGDQPALICELVDWAQVCGFEVVCAGKGTRHLPAYHRSTPATVWEHYGIDRERAETARLNARMFNAFLDGTKSAIEMAAVANATGLQVQSEGLRFPPCGTGRLPAVCVPESAGGVLAAAGVVEVVSSLERDGTPVPDDLRWGVFVVFAAPSDDVAARFADYGLVTDASGRFAALWRSHHLIGMEIAPSVLSAVLRREPTGRPRRFAADVVAVAKRDLGPGDVLDGEGGETVWGRLTAAGESLAAGALPIGLAHGAAMLRAVPAGQALTRDDVALDPSRPEVDLRARMEASLAG
jgi:predicted homoserine dehydrogenase-like protein